MRTPHRRLLAVTVALPLLVLLACGDKAKAGPDVAGAASLPDTVVDAVADAVADTVADTVADAVTDAGASPHVPVDLTPYVGAGTAKGAYARKISDEADLIGGTAAQGRTGDYLIGNDKVRFVIQGPDRHSSPCPWGGTVLDADVVRPAGTPGHDNLGEYCLFFHLGRTQLAEQFEVLADGKDGGAAVLAVTGPDTVVDFLNLPNALSAFLGASDVELPFDPDEDLPLVITRYYVLRPGESVLRVVTALRNEGAAPVVTEFGELVDSGGPVQFFNPASSLKGFGYKSVTPEPLDFLAFRGEHSTHALAPLPMAGKPGGSYLAISGVAGCLFGTDSALGLLLSGKEDARKNPAALTIPPGSVAVREHHVVVGTGALSTVTDALYAVRGVATGTVQGKAVDVQGAPIPGLRVSAIAEGRARTQFVTAADGTFSGTLPAGKYTFSADAPGRTLSEAGTAEVAAGKTAAVEVRFSAAGRLDLQVRDAKGAPLPAKVTVVCDGACPEVGESQHRDVTLDPLKAGWAAVDFVGASGDLTLHLAPGKYEVTVSRGPAYGLWPADAATSGGQPIAIAAGQTAQLQAVLGKAVDTSGWLGGDFHVHAVNSPDAPVSNLDRVLTFLAEGVDVLVGTDHDFVTDFAPYIAQANAGKWLASIVGVELTTFDYGHYNAFPQPHDPDDLNGGAFDWGGGAGPNVTPQGIAEALQGGDPDRVVQINHPNGGYLSALKIDVKTGISYADPTKFRLPAVTPDPKTGDTGLFTTAFTAMELYNGYSVEKFNTCVNWWFALLSRGVRWTGTAVSDTHNWSNSQAGGPRSWVQVGAGKDSVQALDQKHYAKAINAMRVVGSNGPFFRVQASAAGKSATLGETLAVAKGGEVTLEVEIQAPTWMHLDAVELYKNPTDTAPAAGEQNAEAPKPHAVQKLTLQAADAVPGFEAGTQRWLAKVTFTDQVDADGYYVVFVRGSKALPEALVAGKSVKPFAFSNPIFVDADGGGYDHPPLGKQTPPPPPPKGLAGRKRDLDARDFEAIVREIEAHDH